MDLFRYFHPHHNPRLRHTSLRAQELGELELAALEIYRALERAQVRTESAPIGDIRGHHFDEPLVAAAYLVETLTLLAKAHPGDDEETLQDLLRQRQDAPGWENWSRLLKEKLKLLA